MYFGLHFSHLSFRQQYLDFIGINQMAARSLGFNNLQEQWLERYESDDFPGLIEQVWSEKFVLDGKERSLELFYKHLHAYVRGKLLDVYNPQGADIKENGFIPANILGNMWAQLWGEDLNYYPLAGIKLFCCRKY